MKFAEGFAALAHLAAARHNLATSATGRRRTCVSPFGIDRVEPVDFWGRDAAAT